MFAVRQLRGRPSNYRVNAPPGARVTLGVGLTEPKKKSIAAAHVPRLYSLLLTRVNQARRADLANAAGGVPVSVSRFASRRVP